MIEIMVEHDEPLPRGLGACEIALRQRARIQRESGCRKYLRDIVIESVESEVVLLIRQEIGQWPEYQSEIHFPQTPDAPRKKAAEVVNNYRSALCPTG